MAFEFDEKTARPAGDVGGFDESTAKPYTAPKSSLIRRGIGDTALSLGQGAVGAVKSIADVAGVGTRVSKGLGDLGEGMQGLLSPERRAEMAARQAKVEEADQSGSTLDQVTSRLGGFAEAPVQTLAQGIGSMAPTVAAAIATRGKSLAAPLALGTAIGVGGIKGQNYDAVKAEALKQGKSEAEAEALAQTAAEYSRQNAGQQILGGALGALDAGTGVERIVRGVVGQGEKLGRRVVKGALEEGLPEGAQGAQGQYAQNLALNDAGFQTDPGTGVLGQGILEGAIGGVLGAAAGVPRPREQRAIDQPPVPIQTPGDAIRATAPPVSGPLTGAVNVGIEQEARAADAGMAPLPVGQAQELTGEDAARAQREADRPAAPTGAIRPDDITRDGQPFTSIPSANRALAKAGPGYELAPVAGGLVVRRVAAAQPAAGPGPLSQFLADNAYGAETLARGVLDEGFDTSELTLEQANALATQPSDTGKIRRIPTGTATEIPLEVAEGVEPNVPEFNREPRTAKSQPTRAMTDADVVRAYVEQRRTEGTLAGRRFAGDFDAGRITEADVLALVRPRTQPTPDERLASAAAQAPVNRQTGLLDANGNPIAPTEQEPTRVDQRSVPGTAGVAAGAGDGRAPDAGAGRGTVGPLPAVAGGLQPAPGKPVAGGPSAAPAGRGTADGDRPLTVLQLKRAWSEAVAKGDTAEAARINDLIVQAKKAQPAPSPAEGDSAPPKEPSNGNQESSPLRPDGAQDDGQGPGRQDARAQGGAVEGTGNADDAQGPRTLKERRAQAQRVNAAAPGTQPEAAAAQAARPEAAAADGTGAAAAAAGARAGGVEADGVTRGKIVEAYKRAAQAKYPGRDTERTAEAAADRLLSMIQAKNADGLIAMNLGSADMNPASRAGFEAATGVKLPKGRASTERAIDEWAGVTAEQRAAKDAARSATREAESAAKDAEWARKSAAAVQVKEYAKKIQEFRQRAADVVTSGGKLNTSAQPAQETPESGQVERRTDLARRKRVAEMSDAEMRAALLTDDLTGLNNGRWLRESEGSYSHIVAFDADSLKWVNDNMGHEAGDMLLKAWGAALKAATPNAARVGGDEFFALANSRAEAQTIAQAVESVLSAAVITASTPTGDVTINGLGTSFGIATDRKAADEALNQHKRYREAAGTRAGRGEQPPGTTRGAAGGQQDQADQGGGKDDPAGQAGVAPAATHADPGEPAEPVTPAVVRDAIKTAADSEGRSRSAMKAEALKLIDAAMSSAKGADDADVLMYEAARKLTADEQAAYKRLSPGPARDKYMKRLMDEKDALSERAAERIGYVNISIPGDGAFKILNTQDRLAEFRRKVEKSPGFKDRQLIPQSDRVSSSITNRTKDPNTAFGVEDGSGGKMAAFSNMVDDGDMQAALDYAEAVGVDPKAAKLTDVLRKRLDKWMRDQEMAAATAAYEARKPGDAPPAGSLAGMMAAAQPGSSFTSEKTTSAAEASSLLATTLADRRRQAAEARQAPAAAPASLKERRERAAAERAQQTAQGAIDAFNAGDSARAVAIMQKLKLADLETVGAAVGFRPQIGENATKFRERIAGVADKLTKTARTQAARERKLFDQMQHLATQYDDAKQHAERAKANGVTDPESTAFLSFYRPTPYGETTEMRIPAMLERLRTDMQALESDPDYATVAPMVRKARPGIFEAKPAEPAAPAAESTTPDPLTISREQYVDARLESARNDPADPEYRVMQNYAGMGQVGKWERGFKGKLEAEHLAAAQQARESGASVSDAVRYDYPRMFIRDDLSDGQADEASDAMTVEYRKSGDFGKAVQVYREWGATTIAAEKAAPASLNKPRSTPKKQALTPAGALKADATNSRADSAVWYYQGDMGRLQFTASVTIDGKPDPGAADAKRMLAQIKAAQDAGWRRANYRAGSLGTVWVFERDGDFLTRAGMENADSDVTAWPDIPSYGAGYDNMVRGQTEFATALNRWLNTLPEDQQQNQGVVSRKMADVLGGWAGIERDKIGLHVRFYPRQDDKKRVVGWTHTIPASQTWEEARAKIAALAGQPEPQPAQPTPTKTEPATKTPTVDAHMALFKAVRAGTATPDEFKALYARVRDGKDAIVAELNTSTKDQLLKDITGGNFRPGTTKGEVVEAIYKSMLRRFALGKNYGPSSYMLGQEKAYAKATSDALDALVEGQTAESLAEYAAELKAEFDAAMTARAARLESIKDPKTLVDFRTFMRVQEREGKTYQQARMMLTPEQRATYDELSATESRGRRTSAKDEQRNSVRVAGQTVDGEIIATKHTRDGHDLFVVRLAERVSTEDYRTLLDGAKRIGGSYSSFRGNGAVPGFQFRTREAAQAFQKLAQGDNTAAVDAAKERRDAFADDRSQTAVQRLTEMADRLEERADESLGRERKANTDRRARFAASAEAAAQGDKAMAKTMRNIAGAIEAGTAKFLDRVRQKAQVEMLQGYVRTAKDAEIRAKHDSYAEQERHKGERPTGETADYAEFPTFTAFRSDLASLGRQLVDVDGTKLMGQRLLKVADDVSEAFAQWARDPGNYLRLSIFTVNGGQRPSFPTADAAERAIARSGFKGKAIVFSVKRGEHTILMSPSEAMARGIWKGDGDKRITLDADFGAELVEKMGRANRRGAKVSVPWQFESAYDRRKALSRMGIETAPEFRAALREFIGLREQVAPPDKVKELERAMIGRRNDGLDFFPTPEETADAMVEAAALQPGMRVLEPSAGMGHIAERIRAAGFEPDVGEVSNDRRALLEAKGFNVVGRDFLETQARAGFTYGDTFRAPDGTVGIMRGLGGAGSDHVRLVVNGDERTATYHNRSDLEPVKRNNDPAGALVPRADLVRLESLPTVRGDVLSSVRNALTWYDKGDYQGAALMMDRATRQAEFNPEALDAFADIVDRLLAASEGQYDRILMNPPFSEGRDIAHVRHAYDLLKPGGRLVALMGESAFTNQNKRATEFREWLESVGGTEEKLAEGTFLDPSLPVNTGANARMVVVEKPEVARGDEAAFSRGRGTGIPLRDAQAVVAAIRQANPTAPPIQLLDSVQKAPEKLLKDIKAAGAMDDVEAAYHDGEVYVFYKNIASIDRALFVIGHHELRHHGLRAMLGKDMHRVMFIMGRQNAALGVAARAKMAAGLARDFVTGVEEALADMPVEALAKLTGWDRVVAAVRQWLRNIGDAIRRTNPTLATLISPKAWTDRDVAAMVARAESISRAGSPMSGGDGTAFQRAMFSRAPERDEAGRFSRTAPTAGPGMAQQRPVREQVRNTLADMLGSAGAKVSWWDKTLGTQYAKAQKFPAFKAVFDHVQQYLDDTSSLANEAANQAKDILPKLETWKDLGKFGLKDADAKALAGPVFQGTLTDKKVYTDAELRSQFNLTDAQIGQYRQFLAAVNTSLDQVVAADVMRLLGDKNPMLRDLVINDRAALREGVTAYLQKQIDVGIDPEKNTETLKSITDRYERIDQLKAEGYAPLMRFGRFKLHITDPEGGTLFFGLYESRPDANKAARDLAADPAFQGARIEQGVLSQEQYKMFAAIPLDSMEMFAEAIGADQVEVFQEYIKLAKSNRSAMKRLIQRKGTAGFAEDVPRVLAAFVTSNARMASGALNMPAAKDAALNIRDGDVQDEAIKLIDVAQNPKETAGAVRGLMFANFIGGSIASAVVNLTQPITMTLPYLSQWGGPVKSAARLMAAGKMASTGKIDDDGLKEALKRAEDGGIVSPQEIHFLTAQAMGTMGNHPLMQRAAFIWAAPFSLAEQFNRRVSFIAAYNTATEQGIEDSYAFAEKAVIETQGLYNAANAPNWARNPIGATALTFKQFSIHYLEWMGRMWNAGRPGSPERRNGRIAVGVALALLVVAGGSDGLPFAEDLDDLIDTLGQALGYDVNSKRARRAFVANTLGLGDEVADIVARGFSAAPGIPLDVSLRMGMGNLIPATGVLLRSNVDRSSSVLEVAGPAGGLAKQALDAGQKLLAGDVAGAATAAAPVAAQNVIKAMQMWSTGEARDTRDRKVMNVDEVDGLMKFLGFNPQAIARESERMGMIRRSEQLAKNVEGEIAGKWARGVADKDMGTVADARKQLAQWNTDNPEQPIRITPAQVMQRARKLMQDREARFITSTAPERRAVVREALQ